MNYKKVNISKSQISSLFEIQDEMGNKLSQRDNNLEHLFKIIKFTKKNRSNIQQMHNKSTETFDLTFQLNFPQKIEKITNIVRMNPLDTPIEIVSEYLIQSARELDFSSEKSLIENLNFQLPV